jgi:hypothetical protein
MMRIVLAMLLWPLWLALAPLTLMAGFSLWLVKK